VSPPLRRYPVRLSQERRWQRVAFAFAVPLVSDVLTDGKRAKGQHGYLEFGRAEIADEVAPVSNRSGSRTLALTCRTVERSGGRDAERQVIFDKQLHDLSHCSALACRESAFPSPRQRTKRDRWIGRAPVNQAGRRG